jgi:hypothetical protein
VISLVVSGTPSRIATINVGTLAAGASGTVASTVSGPTTPGAYPIIATATTTDPESDSSNNTTSSSLTVVAATPSGCDYYAAPGGTGNGTSPSTPFRVSNFWAVARPGLTLCLLDGVYMGPQSMITPGIDAVGLSGTSGQPITIRALNDGAVTIDGQFARRPVHLSGNNWFVLQGFNAHSSSASVVRLDTRSSNNVFRRIVAWDAAIDGNAMVYAVQDSSLNNKFEDIAGFGTGRKIFSIYGGSHNTEVRRAWFRWEGGTWGSVGPAATASYLSKGTVFENVLVTWSGESMPETYTVANPNTPGISKINFQPFGTTRGLGLDRLQEASVPKHGNLAIRGSMTYVKATDRLPSDHAWNLVQFNGESSVTLTDVLAVMSPSHPSFNDNNYRSISLQRGPNHGPEGDRQCANLVTPGFPCALVNVIATRLTALRGARMAEAFHGDWAVVGISAGTTLGAIQTPWQNTSTMGARLCYRTENGVTGTTPLWPWPMNDRIKAATAAAGRYNGPCSVDCVGGRAVRTPTDVTADIETLLGRVPGSCRR